MDPLTAMLNARKANVRAPGGIQNFGAQDMASILQQQQLNRGAIGARIDGPAPTMVRQDPNFYADRKEARDFAVLDAIQARKDAAARQQQADLQAMARQKLSDANALTRQGLADFKADERLKLANQKAIDLEGLNNQNALNREKFRIQNEKELNRIKLANEAKARVENQARIDKQFAGVAPAMQQSINQWEAWGRGTGPGSRAEFTKKKLNDSFESIASTAYTPQQVQDAYRAKVEKKEERVLPADFTLRKGDPNYMQTVKEMIQADEKTYRSVLSQAQRRASELTSERDRIISSTFNRSMEFLVKTGLSVPGGVNSLSANLAPPSSESDELPNGLMSPDALFGEGSDGSDGGSGGEEEEGSPLIPQYQRDASLLAAGAGKIEDAIKNFEAGNIPEAMVIAGLVASTSVFGALNDADKAKLIEQFEAEVKDRTTLSKSGKTLNKTNTARKLESHWKNGKFDDYMKELGSKHGVTFTDDDLKDFRKKGKAGRKLIPKEFTDMLDKKKGGWIKQLSRGTKNVLFPMGADGKRSYNPLKRGGPDTTKSRFGKAGIYATGALSLKSAYEWITALPPEEAKKEKEILDKIAGAERMQADHDEMVEVIDINESSSYARSQIETLRNELSGGSESNASDPIAPESNNTNSAAYKRGEDEAAALLAQDAGPPPIPVENPSAGPNALTANQTSIGRDLGPKIMQQMTGVLPPNAGVTDLMLLPGKVRGGSAHDTREFTFMSGGMHYRGNVDDNGQVVLLKRSKIIDGAIDRESRETLIQK